MIGLGNLYRGAISSGGSGGDDDGCKEERRRAQDTCSDAYANGWRSDYDVGPYRKPDGTRWTVQDCVRGLVSERCGGNKIDRGGEAHGNLRRRQKR